MGKMYRSFASTFKRVCRGDTAKLCSKQTLLCRSGNFQSNLVGKPHPHPTPPQPAMIRFQEKKKSKKKNWRGENGRQCGCFIYLKAIKIMLSVELAKLLRQSISSHVWRRKSVAIEAVTGCPRLTLHPPSSSGPRHSVQMEAMRVVVRQCPYLLIKTYYLKICGWGFKYSPRTRAVQVDSFDNIGNLSTWCSPLSSFLEDGWYFKLHWKL